MSIDSDLVRALFMCSAFPPLQFRLNPLDLAVCGQETPLHPEKRLFQITRVAMAKAGW
jgi:hypothetical protein